MTIYNMLNTLAELGLINVLVHAGDDNVHYEADTKPMLSWHASLATPLWIFTANLVGN